MQDGVQDGMGKVLSRDEALQRDHGQDRVSLIKQSHMQLQIL